MNHEEQRTAWYIRDATGNIISVYEQAGVMTTDEQTGVPAASTEPLDLVEVPVYGSGKLGTFYPGEDGSMAYEVTDHLGNVRALLRDNITAYTATMEDDGTTDITNPRVQEKMLFLNLDETSMDDANMNHTSPSATSVTNPSRSAYLLWQDGVPGSEAADKAIGPAIVLEVNAGDEIELETWARFRNKTSYARDFDLLALSTLLGNNLVGAPGFDGVNPTQVATNFNGGLGSFGFGSDDADASRPYAYLNYALFRDDYTVIDAGWRRVPPENRI